MGETAENVAEQSACSREDRTHSRSIATGGPSRRSRRVDSPTRSCRSRSRSRKGDAVTVIDRDEHPARRHHARDARAAPAGLPRGRLGHGREQLGHQRRRGCRPARRGGPGARELGLQPFARVVATAVAGVDPAVMGIGPVPATRKALERAGLGVDDLDLIELNEAFAAQSIACIDELGLDPARVNVNGGAIALGHPLGMSGGRLVTMLVHELRRTGGRYGLATMCIGVGQGIATIVERIDG